MLPLRQYPVSQIHLFRPSSRYVSHISSKSLVASFLRTLQHEQPTPRQCQPQWLLAQFGPRRLSSFERSVKSNSQQHDRGNREAGSLLSRKFWSCQGTWRRASVNTLRCLIGCTSGDFAALWMLQLWYPDLAIPVSMAISSMSLPPFTAFLPLDLGWETSDRI